MRIEKAVESSGEFYAHVGIGLVMNKRPIRVPMSRIRPVRSWPLSIVVSEFETSHKNCTDAWRPAFKYAYVAFGEDIPVQSDAFRESICRAARMVRDVLYVPPQFEKCARDILENQRLSTPEALLRNEHVSTVEEFAAHLQKDPVLSHHFSF